MKDITIFEIPLKNWAEFLRGLYNTIRKDYKAFLKVQSWKRYWRQYQPLYTARTEAEHARIRAFLKKKIDLCGHRKGGKLKGFSTDFNISDHTFIDGSRRVKCLNNCGKVWSPGDADWKDALYMLGRTTNRRTSSEQPGYLIRANGEEKFYNSVDEIKKVFPNWDIESAIARVR